MPAENSRSSQERYAPSRPHKRFVQAVDNAFRNRKGNAIHLPSQNGISQIVLLSERRLDPRLYISQTTPSRTDGSQEFIIANLTHDPKDHSSYNANGIRIKAKTKEKKDGSPEVTEVLSTDRVTATLTRPKGKTLYDSPPPQWRETTNNEVKPKHIATLSRNLQRYLEDPTSRKGKLVIKTTSALLATALLAAPIVNGIQDASHPHQDTTQTTTSEIPGTRGYEYPYQPTQEEISAITTLLNEHSGLSDSSLPILYAEKIPELTRIQAETADRYDLTVHNYYEFMRNFTYEGTSYDLWADIYNQETNEPQLAYDVYFNAAKEFLTKYGITLSLQTETTQFVSPLSQEAYETREMKRTLANLIEQMGPIPAEMIQSLGVKQIKLANIIKEDVAGQVSGENSPIYLDPTHSNYSLFHEAYHLFDHQPQKEGGMVNIHEDPIFTQYNPLPDREFYGTNGDPRGISPDPSLYISEWETSFKQIQLESQINTAKSNGDLTTAQELEKQLKEMQSKIVVATPYGFSDPGEDKAEIAERLLFTYQFFTMLDPDKPVLRDKAITILARFYHENPNFVKYLADTSIQRVTT